MRHMRGEALGCAACGAAQAGRPHAYLAHAVSAAAPHVREVGARRLAAVIGERGRPAAELAECEHVPW